MLSKLTHLFLSLPRPDASWIQRLETLFFKFKWGGKNDKLRGKQCSFMKFDDLNHKINKLPFTLYEGIKKAIIGDLGRMSDILQLTKSCNHISPMSLEFDSG